MKCEKCKTEFKVHGNASFGHGHDDTVEVIIECPKCEKRYYDFTSNTWTAFED